ncbi:uncharacterized protein isoform X3 [Rhodnius prolixus]|uniref:uncharacterized protein isoform X3 n=1 Tax=Rhodnius prolixus TaxID=13249 RepID=UPI003D18B9E3
MMTGYSSSKIAVKDSFDDDEASDDVEDEVFIRDGRNGFKVDEEIGVKRPLMAPRRKCKPNKFRSEIRKRPFYRRFYFPYCYTFLSIAVILGSIIGLIMVLSIFPIPFDRLRQWKIIGSRKFEITILPCTDYSVKDVWHQSFLKYTSEAALVLTDLNDDEIDDIVLGYATGVEDISSQRKCSDYPGSSGTCGGGAVALDGRTGSYIWQYWTRRDVLFVDCSANVNADKTNDCLLSGKGGVLCTVDGKTGNLIWEVEKPKTHYEIDIYSAQYTSDLDGDGYSDVLVAHTSDQSGLLIVLSGRNGVTIGQIETPRREGLYTVPRITVTPDSTYMVIFATGQPNIDSGGALYAVPLHSIAMSDEKRCAEVWRDNEAGVSSGIVLADMNNDGMEDIIITSGSRLSAINGSNFALLWNISSNREVDDELPKQILIGPTPAYFDDDSIPDLLINHLVGPSFPLYFFSQTWVAGGKNGEPLLDEPMIGAGDITAPGITVSFNGVGNDMYLFWITSCNNHVQLLKTPFILAQGSTMHERTHTDLCKLRFNKTLETHLYALNQHIKPPGLLIYSSKSHWDVEHNNTFPFENIKKENKVNRKWSKTNKFNKNKIKPQQDVSNYFTYPQERMEDGSLNNFARYQENLNEQSQSPVRTMTVPSLDINLGELAMDYEPLYSQEVDPPEDVTVDLDEGRDERANIKKRIKKHLNKDSQKESLARATTTGKLP